MRDLKNDADMQLDYLMDLLTDATADNLGLLDKMQHLSSTQKFFRLSENKKYAPQLVMNLLNEIRQMTFDEPNSNANFFRELYLKSLEEE